MCRFSTWETSFECQKYYLYRSIYIFMCQFSICFIPPAHNRTNTCKQPTQMLMISIGKCLSIFKQTIRNFRWTEILYGFKYMLVFLSAFFFLSIFRSYSFSLHHLSASVMLSVNIIFFLLDLEYVRTHQEHCCTSDSTIINLVFRRFPSAASLHDRCIVKWLLYAFSVALELTRYGLFCHDKKKLIKTS